MRKYIISVVALVSLICCSAQALYLEQIERQARFAVNDTTDTVNDPRYSQSFIWELTNSVQDKIVKNTLCLYKEGLINGVTDQMKYVKPADCIKVDRILFQFDPEDNPEKYQRIEYTTLGVLYKDKKTWESYASGVPQYCYEMGQYIGIVPAPTGVYASTGAIKLQYYYRPPTLSSSTAIPFDGRDELIPYHNIIVLGVEAMLFYDMGDTEKYAACMAEYQSELAYMKDMVKWKPDIGGGTIGVK